MKQKHEEIKFKSPFLEYHIHKNSSTKNQMVPQKGYKNNKLYRSDMHILTKYVNLLNQQKDENYENYTNVLIANKKQCAQLKRSCNYHVTNMILPSNKMFSPFKIRYYSERKKAIQKKLVSKKQKQEEYKVLSENKQEQIDKKNLMKQQSSHKNLRQVTSKTKGRRHINNILKTSLYLKQQQQKKNLTYIQIYHPIYIQKQKNQLQSLKQMISKTSPLLQEQSYLPKIKKNTQHKHRKRFD